MAYTGRHVVILYVLIVCNSFIFGLGKNVNLRHTETTNPIKDEDEEVQKISSFDQEGSKRALQSSCLIGRKRVRIHMFRVNGEDADNGEHAEVQLKLDSHAYYPKSGFISYTENRFYKVANGYAPWYQMESFKSLVVGLEEDDDWPNPNDFYSSTLAPSAWYNHQCTPYEVRLYRNFKPEVQRSLCWNVGASVEGSTGGATASINAGVQNCARWTEPAQSYEWYISVLPVPSKLNRIAVGQAYGPHRIMFNHDSLSQANWNNGALMNIAGWYHKMEFYASPIRTDNGMIRIAVGEAFNPHRIMINHKSRSQTYWNGGGLMNVAGWKHKMSFWAYTTRRTGTIRIAVGEAYGPHRIMINHNLYSQDWWNRGYSMNVEGWKTYMDFWVPI